MSFLSRHDGLKLHVFPLLVRPWAWKAVDWMTDLTMLPRDGRALASLRGPRAEEVLRHFVIDLASAAKQWIPPTSQRTFLTTRVKTK